MTYPDQLSAVAEAMQEPSEQPLAQWLNTTFAYTETLLGTVAGPDYRWSSRQQIMDGLGISYDDVRLMAQIATRLQLVASNIDCRDTKLKVVR